MNTGSGIVDKSLDEFEKLCYTSFKQVENNDALCYVLKASMMKNSSVLFVFF